jgi:hypothetical protein
MLLKICFLLISLLPLAQPARSQPRRLRALASPVLLRGDAKTAYRDPAVLYEKGTFYLYYTLVETEADGRVYSYVAFSTSPDLKTWTAARKITERNQNLDFSSPGNIIRYQNEWVLCLQTYPRPNYTADQMPRFGTGDARLFLMRSPDLRHWSAPELLRVKGPAVDEKSLGRMIDPYLLPDLKQPGQYSIFYKQNGVSRSTSTDLVTWTFAGSAESGENVCVLAQPDGYYLFNSPKNGINIKKSSDLQHWVDWQPLITLGQGQPGWDWAKGRLTAGAALDLRHVPGVRRYLLFFHGSGPLTEEQGDFDKNASIGLAWSTDLRTWHWPGE